MPISLSQKIQEFLSHPHVGIHTTEHKVVAGASIIAIIATYVPLFTFASPVDDFATAIRLMSDRGILSTPQTDQSIVQYATTDQVRTMIKKAKSSLSKSCSDPRYANLPGCNVIPVVSGGTASSLRAETLRSIFISLGIPPLPGQSGFSDVDGWKVPTELTGYIYRGRDIWCIDPLNAFRPYEQISQGELIKITSCAMQYIVPLSTTSSVSSPIDTSWIGTPSTSPKSASPSVTKTPTVIGLPTTTLNTPLSNQNNPLSQTGTSNGVTNALIANPYGSPYATTNYTPINYYNGYLPESSPDWTVSRDLFVGRNATIWGTLSSNGLVNSGTLTQNGNSTVNGSSQFNGNVAISGALSANSISTSSLSVPNSLTSTGNTMTSNVGGSVGTGSIINTSIISSSGNIITTSINGVTATGVLVNTHTISSSGNVLTSETNGVTTTGSIINTASLVSSGNTLIASINGVTATGDIITGNTLSLSGNLLTSIINTISTSIALLSDNVAEWTTNLYYTTARFVADFTARFQSAFDSAFSNKTTDNLAEGTGSLYFTNQRAQNAMSGTIAGINANIATLSGSLATLTTTVNTISGSLSALSGTVASNFNTLSGSILTTNTTLSTLSGVVSTLTNTVNTLSGSLNSLSGTVASNFSTLSGSIATTNTNLTTVSGALAALTITVNTLSGSLNSLSGTVANLTTTVTNNYNTLSGAISTTNTTLNSLSGTVASNFSTLSGALASLSGTVTTLSNTVNTMSGQIAALQAASHAAVTLGTPNGLSLSGQQLSLSLASSTTTGALSMTDWNSFANKQNTLIAGAGIDITGDVISAISTNNWLLGGNPSSGQALGSTDSFLPFMSNGVNQMQLSDSNLSLSRNGSFVDNVGQNGLFIGNRNSYGNSRNVIGVGETLDIRDNNRNIFTLGEQVDHVENNTDSFFGGRNVSGVMNNRIVMAFGDNNWTDGNTESVLFGSRNNWVNETNKFIVGNDSQKWFQVDMTNGETLFAGSAGTAGQFLRTQWAWTNPTWTSLDTSMIPENGNLYYSDMKVRGVPLIGFIPLAPSPIVAWDSIFTAFQKLQGTNTSQDTNISTLSGTLATKIWLTALSALGPVTYNNTTGVFGINTANSTTTGALSPIDWNTFNNKQSTISLASPANGLAFASNILGLGLASSTTTGALSTTDYNIFKNNWSLTGNAGTLAATNFIGTTDAVDFVTRTNNTERMRILANGNVGIGAATPGNSLEITSAGAGLSGLRFTNLTSFSATGAYNGKQLSVNGSGDVIMTDDATSANKAWWTTGNTGLSALTNFIGTTDAVDLVLKWNNIEGMRLLAGSSFVWQWQLTLNSINSGDMVIGGDVFFKNPWIGNSPGAFQWMLTNDHAAMYVQENASDRSDYTFKMGDNSEGDWDRYVFWETSYLWATQDKWPLVMQGNTTDFYPRFVGNNHITGWLVANSSVLHINQNTRNVGIGTTTPSDRLQVAGGVTATAFTTASDSRFKQGVTDIGSDALTRLAWVRPVTYTWNALGQANGGRANDIQYGMIAQEVESLFPDLVETRQDGYKGINYQGFVPVLIKAVTSLDANKASTGSLDSLSGSLATLSGQIALLSQSSGSTVVNNNYYSSGTTSSGTSSSWVDTAFSFVSSLLVRVEATFSEMVTFMKSVVFRSTVTFEDRVTFSDTDMAGTATIRAGESSVRVDFSRPYSEIPRVTVTADAFVTYRVTDKMVTGFTIETQSPVSTDTNFDWMALMVRGLVTTVPSAPSAPSTPSSGTDTSSASSNTGSTDTGIGTSDSNTGSALPTESVSSTPTDPTPTESGSITPPQTDKNTVSGEVTP